MNGAEGILNPGLRTRTAVPVLFCFNFFHNKLDLARTANYSPWRFLVVLVLVFETVSCSQGWLWTIYSLHMLNPGITEGSLAACFVLLWETVLCSYVLFETVAHNGFKLVSLLPCLPGAGIACRCATLRVKGIALRSLAYPTKRKHQVNSKKITRSYRWCEFSFRNSGKLVGCGACNPSTQEGKQEDQEFNPSC